MSFKLGWVAQYHTSKEVILETRMREQDDLKMATLPWVGEIALVLAIGATWYGAERQLAGETPVKVKDCVGSSVKERLRGTVPLVFCDTSKFQA